MEPSRTERATAGLLFAELLLLRLAYIFRYYFDSDEGQHLHVIWGWTRGLVQYRDLFDNHAPLFHLICAPLAAALGERPDLPVRMRLAMLPISVLALWCTFSIGRALFSPRVGLWAALVAGLFPPFFLLSVEFRPDTLWTALWLWALALLVGGRPTCARGLAVGLILGAAMGVSIKTTLLLASLGAAGLGAGILAVRSGWRPSPRSLARWGGMVLIGFAVVPAGLCLFFLLIGAWSPFIFGVFGYNTLRGLGLWEKVLKRAALFPLTLFLLGWCARGMMRSAASVPLGARRVLVFLAAGIYISGLLILWPMVEKEHKLPFYPLLSLGLGALSVRLVQRLPASMRSCASRLLGKRSARGKLLVTPKELALALLATLNFALLLALMPIWHNHMAEQIDLLADVLRLTGPNEPVLDLKGETVFRPRPIHPALEIITRERIRLGLVADRIPEELSATRTHVAVLDHPHFPPRTRAFLAENFIPVGRLRVAGRFLGEGAAGREPALAFDVGIPGRYAVVSDHETVVGQLDGWPYRGPRSLKAGRHQFVPARNAGCLVLVWAQAVERGFSPFPEAWRK